MGGEAGEGMTMAEHPSLTMERLEHRLRERDAELAQLQSKLADAEQARDKWMSAAHDLKASGEKESNAKYWKNCHDAATRVIGELQSKLDDMTDDYLRRHKDVANDLMAQADAAARGEEHARCVRLLREEGYTAAADFVLKRNPPKGDS